MLRGKTWLSNEIIKCKLLHRNIHTWPTYYLGQLSGQVLPQNLQTNHLLKLSEAELDKETTIEEGGILNFYVLMSDFSIEISCVIIHICLLLYVCDFFYCLV